MVRTPFNQTVLLGTRWGHMIALTCDPYQSGSLCMYGEWAREECELLCSFLQPGDVALDVGANIGTMTVPLAKRVGPDGLVLAFEPQRPPFACLLGNCALTHVLRQTRCFNVAVSNDTQPVQVPTLTLDKPFNVGGVRIGDPAYDAATQDLPREVVPCVTLDQFDLPRVDLIKIDVEAMEAKVLAGAARTIDRCRPVIFAEALYDNALAAPLRGQPPGREHQNVDAMLAFFAGRSYGVRFVDTPLFSPANLRYCSDNIFPGGDRNLVAIPDEKEQPPWWKSLPTP